LKEAHLHEGNLYEVIKVHAYGTKVNHLELCEFCIRKMWHESWLQPETKKILEDLMTELKIYDN
jgi:hypothetical protein